MTLLGPLPEVTEEGVEFTDVSADWIYYQKSTGLTELRGHVMIVYDTAIISCDEATLDEKNEIYRFFGEGRVFVDDADFTLECDELEIHDAEDEKTIYIKGRSTLVVFADEDAEPPGPDSTRRQRLEYALKQQDTTITFTDAEYDYKNKIFKAHGGVRFEQSDKYAQGDEFYGEKETEHVRFTGHCEFWQKDGKWLYEHKIVEDKESPPSKGDRITRALLSVPTTITCDEMEAKGKEGFLQLRSSAGNVVYFRQDDKHAECETFTVWYEEEEEKPEEKVEGPRNLLAETPPPGEEKKERVIPPGFGSLPLAEEFPPDYVPWVTSASQPQEFVNLSAGEGEEFSSLSADELEFSGGGSTEGISVELSESAFQEEKIAKEGSQQEFEFEFPEAETSPPAGIVGSLAELGHRIGTVRREQVQESTVPHNEIIMEGNVFFRQENGNWLFEYEIVKEEEESKEAVEQYRKWANASADLVHIWLDDEIIEAEGAVKGEQENQDLSADFVRYLGEYDMLYLRGNIVVNREAKHQLMSEEGFVFFSTNVFEALGNVRTKLMVDVEERRAEAQRQKEEGQATASGG